MATELTWLGHGSWAIESAGQKILLDPFLDDSPTAPIKAQEAEADFILVSHGHFDHITDVVPIAKRTGAVVIAMVEVAQWLQKNQQLENTVGMNLGGSYKLPCGEVKMTLAHHSSSLPDGSYGGSPAGFLLKLAEGTIYFACDTALFLDMKLIGVEGVDLAVLPIGDRFTMGPEDSLEAIKLVSPRRVLPAHYNTWPPIEQDADQWADQVRLKTAAEPIVLKPGGKIRL